VWTPQDVNTGLGFTVGQKYVLRVQAQGASPTTIRAKVWRAGTAEPTAGMATGTDSTGPQTAGSVGVRTLNTSTTTVSTPPNIRIDNVDATNMAG
jgi:large repetitive protein